jgi:hypothetical protein
MFTMILRGQGWQARPECLPHVLESQDRYICDSFGQIICMREYKKKLYFINHH